MKEPVHVTVQMATVGIPVKVSALHEVQQVMHYVCSRCDLVQCISLRLSNFLSNRAQDVKLSNLNIGTQIEHESCLHAFRRQNVPKILNSCCHRNTVMQILSLNMRIIMYLRCTTGSISPRINTVGIKLSFCSSLQSFSLNNY